MLMCLIDPPESDKVSNIPTEPEETSADKPEKPTEPARPPEKPTELKLENKASPDTGDSNCTAEGVSSPSEPVSLSSEAEIVCNGHSPNNENEITSPSEKPELMDSERTLQNGKRERAPSTENSQSDGSKSGGASGMSKIRINFWFLTHVQNVLNVIG